MARDRRNPTYKELLARNQQLEAENGILRWNVKFGCLTRQGLEVALMYTDLTGRVCVYWDVDGMKAANDRWGKSGSNVRVKAALHVRASDMLAGQVFSGDEFAAFPLAEEALEMAQRLLEAFHQQEMSGTFVIVPLHPDGPDATLTYADEMCAATKAGQRNRIIDYR